MAHTSKYEPLSPQLVCDDTTIFHDARAGLAVVSYNPFKLQRLIVGV